MKLIILALVLILSLPAVSQNADIPKWSIKQLEKHIEGSKKPIIVNFWATFCKPCIEEIPYFQEAVKTYKEHGVELLLISLDLFSFYPEKIRDFANKRGFTAPIVFLDESDADYFCPVIDSSWSGAIPATVFINNKTGYRKFHEEQLSPEQLRLEIEAMLDSTKY